MKASKITYDDADVLHEIFDVIKELGIIEHIDIVIVHDRSCQHYLWNEEDFRAHIASIKRKH